MRVAVRTLAAFSIAAAVGAPAALAADAENGKALFESDCAHCHTLRKDEPAKRGPHLENLFGRRYGAVEGFDAWISSIRADQSEHRAKADVVGWDRKFDLVKVNPLLRWSRRDVWAFLVSNKVPYNPLHDQGYPSIGCWPCTRPVAEGENDERAGRWAGQAKTECGLHSLDSSQL